MNWPACFCYKENYFYSDVFIVKYTAQCLHYDAGSAAHYMHWHFKVIVSTVPLFCILDFSQPIFWVWLTLGVHWFIFTGKDLYDPLECTFVNSIQFMNCIKCKDIVHNEIAPGKLH